MTIIFLKVCFTFFLFELYFNDFFFISKKGTPEAQMPIPEPSDVEKSLHLNFEDQENECKKLECDLQRISKAKEKVVSESEPAYLEPFQVNLIHKVHFLEANHS